MHPIKPALYRAYHFTVCCFFSIRFVTIGRGYILGSPSLDGRNGACQCKFVDTARCYDASLNSQACAKCVSVVICVRFTRWELQLIRFLNVRSTCDIDYEERPRKTELLPLSYWHKYLHGHDIIPQGKSWHIYPWWKFPRYFSTSKTNKIIWPELPLLYNTKM